MTCFCQHENIKLPNFVQNPTYNYLRKVYFLTFCIASIVLIIMLVSTEQKIKPLKVHFIILRELYNYVEFGLREIVMVNRWTFFSSQFIFISLYFWQRAKTFKEMFQTKSKANKKIPHHQINFMILIGFYTFMIYNLLSKMQNDFYFNVCNVQFLLS